METEKCMISGKRFSAGEQLCDDKKCYVCKDGTWQERFIDSVFGVGP
jgi:hypothetical protein